MVSGLSRYLPANAVATLFWIGTVAASDTLTDGIYETDFGLLSLACAEDVMCFASYEDGRSHIYVARGGEGEAYEGYWAEPDADRTCDHAIAFPNIETVAWGRVTLTPSEDGSTWSGLWGYCSSEPDARFTGTLVPQDLAQDLGRGDPPEPVGGDASVTPRIMGSWIPAPNSGARRSDVYTFNPDGTSAITDGSGMNILRTWDLQNGTFLLDGEPVPLDFVGSNLVLSDVEHERFRLWEHVPGTKTFALDFDPYGSYVPLHSGVGDPVMVGDYALKHILLGAPEDFGPDAPYGPPIIAEFWNETEEIKRNEAGNAYRDDTIEFQITAYEITEDIAAFAGLHPEWGELYFEGSLLPDAGHAAGPAGHVLQGDLMVKGHVFRDLAFAHEFLD